MIDLQVGKAVFRAPESERLEAPEEIVLSTTNLSFWYGEKRALDSISMEIPARQVTAIIGPSGCGKSTYLRCFNRMNELIPGTTLDGSVEFRGRDRQ